MKKKRSKYEQLYDALKMQIKDNGYQYQEKLPSIRKLCKMHHISRTTVEMAYGKLKQEGYLESKQGKGYFVVANVSQYERESVCAAEEKKEKQRIPILFPFTTKTVDQQNLDLQLWKKFIKESLQEGDTLRGYGNVAGEETLRRAIGVLFQETYGKTVFWENIIIAAGTQQLLYVMLRMLKKKISCIGIEKNKVQMGIHLLEDLGISYVFYEVENGKIPTDKLEQKGCNSILLQPSDVGGYGESLPIAEKMRLLQWTKEREGYILEDDYNGVLKKYEIEPMFCMGQREQVIYFSTFSKTLLPSVRIAYMMLPKALIGEFEKVSENDNQTASTLEQLALASYIKSGKFMQRIKKLKKRYQQKETVLERCLNSSGLGNKGYQKNGTKMTILLNHSVTSAQINLLQSRGVQVGVYDEKLELCYRGIPMHRISAGVQEIEGMIKGTTFLKDT